MNEWKKNLYVVYLLKIIPDFPDYKDTPIIKNWRISSYTKIIFWAGEDNKHNSISLSTLFYEFE